MPKGIFDHKKYPNMGFQKGNTLCLGIKRGHLSEEHKQKLKNAKLKNPNRYWAGKKRPPFSEETKNKISLAHKGEKNYRWIKDRSKLVRRNRSDPDFIQWRKNVFIRDEYKCKICGESNKYVQAHHILSWREYPELRYEINNGITLCLAHHPRKRAEEKRLAPILKKLVSVSKE